MLTTLYFIGGFRVNRGVIRHSVQPVCGCVAPLESSPPYMVFSNEAETVAPGYSYLISQFRARKHLVHFRFFGCQFRAQGHLIHVKFFGFSPMMRADAVCADEHKSIPKPAQTALAKKSGGALRPDPRHVISGSSTHGGQEMVTLTSC